MKQEVLIQVYESCPDLRMTGSNIYTGMKAHIHVNGRNVGYKIYMTNNSNSINCYIKLKGHNVALENDAIIYHMTPYKLTQLCGWYINNNLKGT